MTSWPVVEYSTGYELEREIAVVLLDGKHNYIGPPWRVRTAVKADLRSVSVAAASVIAKVYRDTLMADLGETCPIWTTSQPGAT